MSEQMSFDDMEGWFEFLVLDSPEKNLTEYFNTLNPSKSREMTVELKINGVELRAGDFNKVMEDWSNRIEAQIKEELEYMQTEDQVKERAREMFYKAINKLDWDE